MNNSNYFIHSLPPNPINISYHWIDYQNMNPFVFDGLRTPFSFPVKPRSIQSLQVRCQAPRKTGLFLLRLSLVQEQHAWFDQDPFLQFAEKLVKIYN